MEQENPRSTGHGLRCRTSSFDTARSDESGKKMSIGGMAMTTRRTSSYIQGSLKKTRSGAEQTPLDARKRNVRYENTFRMEPRMIFPETKVRKIVKDALATLSNHRYDPKASSFVSKLLSKRILDEVRLLNIERYKLVCLVSIGSKSRQGARMASRCLWNTDHDTFVSETLDTQSFYAIATLYAMYYE